MRKWQTTRFKELEAEWEKKLAESGFEDAEKKIAGERVLKQSADYAYRRKEHTEEYREAKLAYYSLISQKIHGTRFDDDSDKLIMEKTAEGWSIQEISRELKHLEMPKFNRDTIRYIRRRYETRWGIRHWKPEEMVSRKVATPSSPTPQLAFQFAIVGLSLRSGKGR